MIKLQYNSIITLYVFFICFYNINANDLQLYVTIFIISWK